jgi:hypothetical protein
MPPHCPYFWTGEQEGVVGTAGAALLVGFAGAALVTSVVGAAVGAADSTGALPPAPVQTSGPGIGYEVAALAASESMLKAMPGSVPLYAPGKETR